MIHESIKIIVVNPLNSVPLCAGFFLSRKGKTFIVKTRTRRKQWKNMKNYDSDRHENFIKSSLKIVKTAFDIKLRKIKFDR
jgi:hypothetical protein